MYLCYVLQYVEYMKKNVRKLIKVTSISLMICTIIGCIIQLYFDEKTATIISLITSILSTIGSIISMFIPSTYTYNFTCNDWESTPDNSYNLFIPATKHELGKTPQVTVFKLNEDGSYEEVINSITCAHGNITINSNLQINGKVIVK